MTVAAGFTQGRFTKLRRRSTITTSLCGGKLRNTNTSVNQYTTFMRIRSKHSRPTISHPTMVGYITAICRNIWSLQPWRPLRQSPQWVSVTTVGVCHHSGCLSLQWVSVTTVGVCRNSGCLSPQCFLCHIR